MKLVVIYIVLFFEKKNMIQLFEISWSEKIKKERGTTREIEIIHFWIYVFFRLGSMKGSVKLLYGIDGEEN